MKEKVIDRRVDFEKLDKQTIDRISSDIVRALTELGEDAHGKFYIKIKIPPIAFNRETFIKIGEPEPEEPDTPGGPPSDRG